MSCTQRTSTGHGRDRLANQINKNFVHFIQRCEIEHATQDRHQTNIFRIPVFQLGKDFYCS
jgi:hypothetical protein